MPGTTKIDIKLGNVIVDIPNLGTFIGHQDEHGNWLLLEPPDGATLSGLVESVVLDIGIPPEEDDDGE